MAQDGRAGSYYFISQNEELLAEVAEFLMEELELPIRPEISPASKTLTAKKQTLGFWTEMPYFYISIWGRGNVERMAEIEEKQGLKFLVAYREDEDVKRESNGASAEEKRKKVLQVLSRASKPLALGRIAKRGEIQTGGLNKILESLVTQGEVEVVKDEKGIVRYELAD